MQQIIYLVLYEVYGQKRDRKTRTDLNGMPAIIGTKVTSRHSATGVTGVLTVTGDHSGHMKTSKC